MDEYMTTGEAAAYLRKRKETIRAWVAKGILPAARIPGRGNTGTELRIPRQAVENMVRPEYQPQPQEQSHE